MSVVTRWRSTFSSSTTQLILLPVCCSHFGERRCMMIMSELLTVAIVIVAADAAILVPAISAVQASRFPSRIGCSSPVSRRSCRAVAA
jgi:hypothetical protein